MDRALLLDAVRQLEKLGVGTTTFAYTQAVDQFNALLTYAKTLYPNRMDIQGMKEYTIPSQVSAGIFLDAVVRLRSAIELRLPGSVTEMVAQIQLPPGAPSGLALDLEELKRAVGIGLHRTPLLLAGLITEAILLSRHPDSSDRGPGLRQLINQAKQERLFGEDTLRHLETLNDYRDLIHTRAAIRNRIAPNETRVEQAIMALKQVCEELKEPNMRYRGTP